MAFWSLLELPDLVCSKKNFKSVNNELLLCGYVYPAQNYYFYEYTFHTIHLLITINYVYGNSDISYILVTLKEAKQT